MIPRPRNTLVLCQLVHQAERKIGGLAVPTANDCYTEAEIIEVGPGVMLAGGARADTFDLEPGQIVFVKHKRVGGPNGMKVDTGIPLAFNNQRYFLMEQSDIGAILFDTRADYESHLAQQKLLDVPAGKQLVH